MVTPRRRKHNRCMRYRYWEREGNVFPLVQNTQFVDAWLAADGNGNHLNQSVSRFPLHGNGIRINKLLARHMLHLLFTKYIHANGYIDIYITTAVLGTQSPNILCPLLFIDKLAHVRAYQSTAIWSRDHHTDFASGHTLLKLKRGGKRHISTCVC